MSPDGDEDRRCGSACRDTGGRASTQQGLRRRARRSPAAETSHVCAAHPCSSVMANRERCCHLTVTADTTPTGASTREPLPSCSFPNIAIEEICAVHPYIS